jgi:hypothetical protein
MGKTHTEILNEIHAMREPELKVPKGIADRKRVVSLIKEIQVVLLPGYFNYNNLSVEAAFDCVEAVSDYTLEDVFETDTAVRKATERLFI